MQESTTRALRRVLLGTTSARRDLRNWRPKAPERALPPLSLTQRVRSFLRRVYHKAGDDDIFFLAGAISFNVLVAIVPLFLFAVGVAGLVLTARFGDPTTVLVNRLLDYIPAVGGDVDLVGTVNDAIEGLLRGRTGLTAVGAVFLVWLSTRLVGTLRVVLREVLDVAQDRGIIGGKIFDVQVVVIGGALVLLNLGITTAMETAKNFGVNALGVGGEAVSLVDLTWTITVSYMSAWVLFLGLYRYLPASSIPWNTAVVAATFTATLSEALKYAFSWYVTSVADYGSTYGNLITIAILFSWIYYAAIVFILGGEVAQVWTMRRAFVASRAAARFEE